MLAAGGIEATVTTPSGEHVTIRVNTIRRSGSGWANCAPTDDNARTNIKVLGGKVGWVNVERVSATTYRWVLTLTTRDEQIKDAVRALFNYCGGAPADTGYRVQEASRCGRCLRTLTDPVSIDRGIGPECYGRDTGSRHATVDVTLSGLDRVSSEARAASEALSTMGQMMADSRQRVAAEHARLQREREHDAEFARRERLQEERAALDGMLAESRLAFAATAPRSVIQPLMDSVGRTSVPDNDKQRARDLIAEALDAFCTDEDRDFAMRTFDQLAAR
jgi:hypothetical protein